MREDNKRHSEVLVTDVMVPLRKLFCMDYQQICQAKVGEIMETLKHNHCEHMLVLERSRSEQEENIRGISFSV